MPGTALAALAGAVVLLSACSREEGLRCESPERYGSSITTPPLSVPDDLTPPDEADVLRVPEGPVSQTGQPEGQPCLETPPEFFDPDGPGNGG